MTLRTFTLAAMFLFLAHCTGEAQPPRGDERGLATATFAGGCFWCMEPPYEKQPGVVRVISGYTGGHTADPTYDSVSDGGTGHYESVQVVYDPKRITYAQLLATFWHNIDPENAYGQFCDNGPQYRAAIFYANEAERRLAEQTRSAIAAAKKIKVVTQILPASRFYPAEEYHQDYYRKNPVRYRIYRYNCGRDARLKELWP